MTLSKILITLLGWINNGDVSMANLTALNEAVANLAVAVDGVSNDLGKVLADFKNAVQNQDQPAVDQATATIAVQVERLKNLASQIAP